MFFFKKVLLVKSSAPSQVPSFDLQETKKEACGKMAVEVVDGQTWDLATFIGQCLEIVGVLLVGVYRDAKRKPIILGDRVLS